MSTFLIKRSFLFITVSLLFFSINTRHKPEDTQDHIHEQKAQVSRFHEWADKLADTFIEYFIPLKKSMEQGWPLIYRLILALLAGFIVSLTPCIYPLIPITAGILRLQASGSISYNFLFSLSYVTGLTLTFSLLGILAASLGIVFGEWFNNPSVIAVIIIFFLYLAFSLFGFYNLYIPPFLKRKEEEIKNQAQGSLGYAFFIGLLSGVTASPCATPALSLMIGYVATTQSVLQGFLLLFFYTFGFSILLIALGTFTNLINYLPNPGTWMIAIERLLGFLLLLLCIYILEPLIPLYITNMLYVFIFIVIVLYYGLFAYRKLSFQ